MADRTVKTTLIVQATGYINGMDQALRKTRELQTETDKLAAKRQAFQSLGIAGIALGTAIALGVGVAVAKFSEFDQAMSQVNAVTQETSANQKLLRDAAIEAGGATIYTAREAANAEEELAKAGLATADVLGGALAGSLDLAASGQLEVARSAEIVGVTLKQFNLEGSQAARVADVLSAGANKAVGSVEDLAQGLKFVGPVAANMNVSLEDTVATLALFSDQGILGEQAGTSLRGMLSSLTSPSKAADTELKRLNVTLYDGNGRFLGLENAAGQLHDALGDATDAERDLSLGILFGNQQVTAARVLVSAGAESWRDYRAAVDDTGIAQRVAAERMDNLAGDVEKLGGAFDSALIKTGSGANDVLRGLAQSATFLVDMIGGLPEPVLGVGLALGVAAAAVTLTGGAALIAVPKFVAFKAALDATNLSAKGLAVGIGLATAAVAAATIGISLFVSWQAQIAATADELTDSLDQTTGAMTDYTRSIVAKKLADTGAFEAAREAGITQKELTDAVIEGGDALDEVTRKLSGNNTVGTFFTGVGIRAGNASQAIRDLRSSLDQSEQKFKDQAAATDEAAAATEDNEAALVAMTGAADEATGSVDTLADAIRGFGSVTLDSREAERQFQAAIDDLTASVVENGATLDTHTDQGRKNEAALDDLAEASLNRAAAIYEETGSQEAATAAIQDGRQALIDALAQFGITGAAADAYADKLGLIPANVNTVVVASTTAADQEMSRFFRTWNGKTVAVNVSSRGGLRSDVNYMGGMYSNGVKTFAQGGFESGIYPYTQGGIHKFAEAGDEAYISFLPQHRQRNIEIWEKSGDRLGAWANPPAAYRAGPSAGAGNLTIIAQSKGGVDLLQYIDFVVAENDTGMALQVEGGRSV